VSLRLTAKEHGEGRLIFRLPEKKTFELPLIAPQGNSRGEVSASGGASSWTLAWLIGDLAIPAELTSSIESITVAYPERGLQWLGLSWNWLVLFFIVSLVAGLIAGKFAKIEI
jgi:hypothetical protein